MNEQVKALLKPIMIDFSQLKEGQEVYDVRRGNGVIKILDSAINTYPLTVHYKSTAESYTIFGYEHSNDSIPSLFLRDPYEYLVEVLERGKDFEDKWYEISVDGKRWDRRKLAAVIDGLKYFYPDDPEERTLHSWRHIREIQCEVLTKQQIADMLGRDVNSFEIKEEGE